MGKVIIFIDFIKTSFIEVGKVIDSQVVAVCHCPVWELQAVVEKVVKLKFFTKFQISFCGTTAVDQPWVASFVTINCTFLPVLQNVNKSALALMAVVVYVP